MKQCKLPIVLMAFAFLGGCYFQSPPSTKIVVQSTIVNPGRVFTPTFKPGPTLTITTRPVFNDFTPTPVLNVCSPIDGFQFAQLPAAITTPFHPPPLGSDDPHQGVDFSDRSKVGDLALEGRDVQAVLAGTVAAVVNNRFPYGNAVFVETPLENLPQNLIEQLQPPEIGPLKDLVSPLTCPSLSLSLNDNLLSNKSLYLLYAHMKAPPTFQPGDQVDCGQTLGKIGQSGNAINPHLHFEIRVGPAGVRLGSMAHYDNSASQEEMTAYCIWRISGYFRVVDPMKIFQNYP
jgi:murein DD-endopeptidase MepM/ murein hydrolase activator NlpD